MKIKRKLILQMTIEKFADKHNLTLEVEERRNPSWGVPPIYVNFIDAEVKDGPILRGVIGNGSTEQEAIADYASRISCQRLVIGAYHQDRREIDVPRLIIQ